MTTEGAVKFPWKIQNLVTWAQHQTADLRTNLRADPAPSTTNSKSPAGRTSCRTTTASKTAGGGDANAKNKDDRPPLPKDNNKTSNSGSDNVNKKAEGCAGNNKSFSTINGTRGDSTSPKNLGSTIKSLQSSLSSGKGSTRKPPIPKNDSGHKRDVLPELIEEKTAMVENLPTGIYRHEESSASSQQEEWELLSGCGSFNNFSHSNKGSCNSSYNNSDGSGAGAVVVAKAGSVRSFASVDKEDYDSQNNNNAATTTTTLNLPFKFQRTASSSTIDSSDNAIGPAGEGVLGVDYVEHVVMPTDTLQGICLAYKLSSTRLRQANHFSGHSLLLAPKKLVIPLSKKALRSGCIRVQDTDAKEYKLHAFLAEFSSLGMTEAKAYLELSDWNLPEAIKSAKEDNEWDLEMDGAALNPGEIRITMDIKGGKPVGFKAQGAGLTPRKDKSSRDAEAVGSTKMDRDSGSPVGKEAASVSTTTSTVSTKNRIGDGCISDAPGCGRAGSSKPIPVAQESIPSIATKTVKAEDVFKAAHQHESFGVELKPIVHAQKKAAESN